MTITMATLWQCRCCPTALAHRRPATTVMLILVTAAFAFTSVALPSFDAFQSLRSRSVQKAPSQYKSARSVTLPLGKRRDDQFCIRVISNDSVNNFPDCCLPDRRACFSSIAYGTIISANANADDSNEQLPDIEKGNRFSAIDPDVLNAPISIALPLEIASGGTFCIRCTVFASNHADSKRSLESTHYDSDFRVYRAIVDTGSPYLVFPSSELEIDASNAVVSLLGAMSILNGNRNSLWEISDYAPTEEVYGAVTGEINWKRSHYRFRDPRLAISKDAVNSIPSTKNLKQSTGIVGVLDKGLTNEATGGGALEPFALLGLIRENNPNADRNRFPAPRPTFFNQACITSENDEEGKEFRVQSFSLDGPNRLLTLSTGSLISDVVPSMQLVDLRIYGDFVDHYAVLVEKVTFDGVLITAQSLKKFTGTAERPIVAVFDTGLTGGLMIRDFWDVVQRKMIEINKNSITDTEDKKYDTIHRFQSVSLSIKQSTTPQKLLHIEGNPQVTTTSSLPSPCKIASSLEINPHLFYIDPIDLDWFDDDLSAPYVIVLGQAFLSRCNLNVDMIKRRASISE